LKINVYDTVKSSSSVEATPTKESPEEVNQIYSGRSELISYLYTQSFCKVKGIACNGYAENLKEYARTNRE
jgi:hypothetical protein